MRRIFSLGAISLLLSGSAMLPGFAESSRAASLQPDTAVTTGLDLSIREAETDQPTVPSELTTPPLPIAPLPAVMPRVLAVKTGRASWYGPGFYGRRTASGEPLRKDTMTAAHPYLPFGTKVRVTNLWNGRSEVVRINDRGPFHSDRLIDLAHGAAQSLGLTASGTARVKLEVLERN